MQYMPFSYELYLHVKAARASIAIKGKGRGEKSFASVHYHSISHRFVFILDSKKHVFRQRGVLRAFVVVFEAVNSIAIVFSLSQGKKPHNFPYDKERYSENAVAGFSYLIVPGFDDARHPCSAGNRQNCNNNALLYFYLPNISDMI